MISNVFDDRYLLALAEERLKYLFFCRIISAIILDNGMCLHDFGDK